MIRSYRRSKLKGVQIEQRCVSPAQILLQSRLYHLSDILGPLTDDASWHVIGREGRRVGKVIEKDSFGRDGLMD